MRDTLRDHEVVATFTGNHAEEQARRDARNANAAWRRERPTLFDVFEVYKYLGAMLIGFIAALAVSAVFNVNTRRSIQVVWLVCVIAFLYLSDLADNWRSDEGDEEPGQTLSELEANKERRRALYQARHEEDQS